MAPKSKAAELAKKNVPRCRQVRTSSTVDPAKAVERELCVIKSLGPTPPLGKTPSPPRISTRFEKRIAPTPAVDLEAAEGKTSKKMKETAGRAGKAPQILCDMRLLRE